MRRLLFVLALLPWTASQAQRLAPQGVTQLHGTHNADQVVPLTRDAQPDGVPQAPVFVERFALSLVGMVVGSAAGFALVSAADTQGDPIDLMMIPIVTFATLGAAGGAALPAGKGCGGGKRYLLASAGAVAGLAAASLGGIAGIGTAIVTIPAGATLALIPCD